MNSLNLIKVGQYSEPGCSSGKNAAKLNGAGIKCQGTTLTLDSAPIYFSAYNDAKSIEDSLTGLLKALKTESSSY